MTIGTHRLPRWIVGILTAFALVMVAGCSASPPEQLEKRSSGLSNQIKDARKGLEKAEKDFKARLKTQAFAFASSYTPEQLHADRFKTAKQQLDQAESIRKNTVAPILDEYEDHKEAKLQKATKDAEALIQSAKRTYAEPAAWLTKVKAVQTNPSGTVTTAKTSLQAINTDFTPLTKDVESAKKTYKDNAAGIDKKFASVASLQSSATNSNELLTSEAKAASPNYALMTAYAASITAQEEKYRKQAPPFRAQLSQLGVRETHTLVDLRSVSYVEISRTSWDDSSDWDTDQDYDYPPVLVDAETADYFAQFGPNDVLAKETGGWGGGFSYEAAEKKYWDRLHIRSKQDLPNDHDAAEFYVTLDETYCHQMLMMQGGKPSPRPRHNWCSQYDTADSIRQGKYWVETDELRPDAIGMDLYSKGYGEFPSDASTAPAPPGMVYVGDEETGEWRKDRHGNTFWHYYGQYMFISQLIGGTDSYHYDREYRTWKSKYRYGKKPYYATLPNGSPRYGMKSPLVTSRFSGSTYVSSGLYQVSVRGAGPAARAGGPGNGGK